MEWETVIGLEVHVQLLTQSKLFSGAATTFGAEPNTQACAVDLGLPGVLPVLNEEAVRLAVKLGLSIHAEIAKHSVFSRKNYFYPDLPKGYQISQYDLPIVGKGELNITLDDDGQKCINITRAHLEEDAGKSLHEELKNASGVDLNRAGIPLLEIVSEPDIRSSSEAVTYLKTLHRLVRYLNVSDANMQEGSFRCDVNISLRPKGATEFGTRVEIKNVNSFRFVEQAIEYEVDRQKNLLEAGEKIIQETRQYDAGKGLTRSMRLKEEAHDYRYFPDPDLLPVEVTEAFIAKVRNTLPELPWEKKARFQKDYGLSDYDAGFLANHIDTASYFEAALKAAGDTAPKNIANWVMGDVSAALKKAEKTITECLVSPEALGELLSRVNDKTISNNIAKQVFEAMWHKEGTADEIIEKRGLKQITDTGAIEKIIDEIITNNPKQLEDYRSGKDKLFGFFVGQVMKATKGKANPQQVNTLLKEKLKGE